MVTGAWPEGPEAPALTAGQAHVWLVHLRGAADMLTTLSPPERARAARFAAGAVRERFVVAHAALRDILAHYCGETPEALLIEAPERGKPYLPTHPEWHFNLSHSGNWGLVAVARDTGVGIDIEEIRSDIQAVELAQRFLAPAEAAHLAALGPSARTEAFFRYWTCKEAFVKALGRGFDLPLRRFTVALGRHGATLAETVFDPALASKWQFHELAPVKGFRAAACLETGGALTACWRWTPREGV